MGVEDVNDLGEIGERAGEAIDLVDDNDLNLAGPDVRQQPLQGRALHRAAGEAAVVIQVGKRNPPGMALTDDIGFASLPLGVERVELLFQPLVGGFARVDGAAENCAGLQTISLPHDARPPRYRLSGLRLSSGQKSEDPTNGLR
jgi:hypothetical protein